MPIVCPFFCVGRYLGIDDGGSLRSASSSIAIASARSGQPQQRRSPCFEFCTLAEQRTGGSIDSQSRSLEWRHITAGNLWGTYVFLRPLSIFTCAHRPNQLIPQRTRSKPRFKGVRFKVYLNHSKPPFQLTVQELCRQSKKPPLPTPSV